MAWKDTRLIDIAIEFTVYVGATHGEHAGKLSALLTTRNYDVYGLGMNTLVTNSTFNGDYPMQEGNAAYFSSWVKVEKLCDLFVRKITVGFGWGAAVTRNHDLLLWGTGATTYVQDPGMEIVELFDPDAVCKYCHSSCAGYGRRIGNTYFSYCKQQQNLVTYSKASPPPRGSPVRRLGNRKYGALTCSTCLTECDIEVIESHSFNFCKNCNHLWDLDENAMAMGVPSKPVQSFLRKLDYLGRIHDVTPCQWGFWVLLESNRIAFSGFFLQPDQYIYHQPIWWKQPLAVPNMKLAHRAVSTHSNKTEVFVVTDAGLLYRRGENRRSRSNADTHKLIRIPLETGVKKMCSGRLSSLCLLEDGTVWVIYSHPDAEQTDVEEVVEKGTNRCLDISGIPFTDLFYVHAPRYRVHLKKRHPIKGNIIEIFFGELNCKTFLWLFSKQSRVWYEGKIAYDEEAVEKLVNIHVAPLQETEDIHSATEAPNLGLHLEGSEAGGVAAISTGLGFQVGATLWSSWGSRVIQNLAVGWRCMTELSKKSYHTIVERIGSKWPRRGKAGSPTSTIVPRPVTLPPFQSGLYGKLQFSDLILRLSNGNFHAHRIILCTTSKYFREKLSGNNADIKMLDMRIHNPRAYRCLLKHFYQLEPDTLNVKDMLDLLVLASTYDERRIAGEVEEKIKSVIDVDNVTNILQVARRSHFTSLREACELFMSTTTEFQESINTNDANSTAPTISFQTPIQTNKNDT